MLGAIITCPLEVVKTRMQSSNYSQKTIISSASAPMRELMTPFRSLTSVFAQPLHMVAHIYRHEGITALWKGLGPNLVGIIPSRGIHFGTYSHMKAFLIEQNQGVETSLVHLLSAAVAGVTVATVTCPIWVVKTRMQLQESGKDGRPKRYANSIDCLRKIVREEGLRALYRGLGASYLGVIEGTIQFVLYERTKKVVMNYRSGQDPSSLNRYQEWFDYFSIAAVSKLAASLLTYPHEVVRTRLREPPPPGQPPKYKGLVRGTMLIFREERLGAFYGGIGAHLMRVVPNAAIMFLGYEFVVKMFE